MLRQVPPVSQGHSAGLLPTVASNLPSFPGRLIKLHTHEFTYSLNTYFLNCMQVWRSQTKKKKKKKIKPAVMGQGKDCSQNPAPDRVACLPQCSPLILESGDVEGYLELCGDPHSFLHVPFVSMTPRPLTVHTWPPPPTSSPDEYHILLAPLTSKLPPGFPVNQAPIQLSSLSYLPTPTPSPPLHVFLKFRINWASCISICLIW